MVACVPPSVDADSRSACPAVPRACAHAWAAASYGSLRALLCLSPLLLAALSGRCVQVQCLPAGEGLSGSLSIRIQARACLPRCAPLSHSLACPARNMIIAALCFPCLRAAEHSPSQAQAADDANCDDEDHEDPTVDPAESDAEAHHVQEGVRKDADVKNVRLSSASLPLSLPSAFICLLSSTCSAPAPLPLLLPT